MNKFKNIPTMLDGIRFASKREANRYQELKLLARAKEIDNLVLQPRFPIDIEGQKICTYVADFQYDQDGQTIVEDAKGVKTPEYKLKKKLMAAVHGIEVKEV